MNVGIFSHLWYLRTKEIHHYIIHYTEHYIIYYTWHYIILYTALIYILYMQCKTSYCIVHTITL